MEILGFFGIFLLVEENGRLFSASRKLRSVACIINIFLTIVNDASTINVIDDASLALASIVNYDCK